MADEINFEVTGFGQLRQQLREAQLEMIKLAAAGKEGTAEFIAAAQKAGQLKEAIKDAGDAANVFTTEGKFQAVTKSLAAVSGGFTAIQGAIGLVSDDTKAFEETFKKLQSAMALTQGLTALSEMGDAFKNLGSVAVSSFNSIKTAIATSGIGAIALFVAAVGTAIGVMVSLNRESKALKKQQEETERAQAALNTVLEESTKLREQELSKIAGLIGAVSQENLKRKDRVALIKEIQKQYPEYLANQNAEKVTTDQIKTANEDLIKTIVKRAKAQAAMTELGKAFEKVVKLEIGLSEKQNDETERRNELFKKGLSPAQVEQQIKMQNNLREALRKKSEEDLKNAKLDVQRIQNYITEEGLINQTTKTFVKSTETKVDGAKIEVQALKDKNEALRKLDEARATEGQDLITTQFANNLARLKENQTEELKQKGLTKDQENAINAKYNELIKLNEQERINAVAKYDKEAKEKADKEEAERLKKLQADREKFEQDRKTSAEKEYRDRKSEIDKIYDEKKLAIEKEEISEEKKQKKLDQLELDRLAKQKINAEDYVATVEEADNDVIDIALKTQEKLKEIDKKTKEERISAFKEYADTAINLAQGITDAIAAKNDAEKQIEIERVKSSKQSEEEKAKAIDAINKEYFEKDKQIQIANAIISTLAGALNAFMSTLKVDPSGITGSILAAAALASGYFQIEKIRATTYQSNIPSGSTEGAKPTGSRYAEGGVLGGPTHDMGGIRTAFGELEGGEFVVNRRATANFLPLLEMINAQGNIAGPEMPRSAYQPVIKTYVLATEVTSAQEANAKIAGLARLT